MKIQQQSSFILKSLAWLCQKFQKFNEIAHFLPRINMTYILLGGLEVNSNICSRHVWQVIHHTYLLINLMFPNCTITYLPSGLSKMCFYWAHCNWQPVQWELWNIVGICIWILRRKNCSIWVTRIFCLNVMMMHYIITMSFLGANLFSLFTSLHMCFCSKKVH